MENKVTKRDFDAATKQYQPNAWIRFGYRYFSKSTEKEDMTLSNTLLFILGGLFLTGFLGSVFNASALLIKWATITYSIILAILVFYLFSVVFINNRRINKIRKVLGVTKQEYNFLVRKFYP